MFLIFGSDTLATRIARWLGKRHRVRMIGLAESIQSIDEVEIVALPTEMDLAEMPLPEIAPTAVLIFEEIICDDEPVKTLRSYWQNTPVLTTFALDGAELISIEDLTASAIESRLESLERREGAMEILQYLRSRENKTAAIFCHDNPDPDALASAYGMQYLCQDLSIEAKIYHGGMIEHQQNKAMVNDLGLELRRLILGWEVEDIISSVDIIIFVDFHKAGANNILPEHCQPHIILDHHHLDHPVAADVAFIRNEFAATSSLVASLLMHSEITMTEEVSTALAFGIRTDTLGFTRSFNAVDLRALSWLNAWASIDRLRKFETPPRSMEVLQSFAIALNNLNVVDGIIYAPIENMTDRDSLSQIADFLLQTEGVESVFTFGARRQKIILSARTKSEDIHLGKSLSQTFPDGMAGGHKQVAGGQIPFTFLDSENEDDAISKMHEHLKTLFGGEMNE